MAPTVGRPAVRDPEMFLVADIDRLRETTPRSAVRGLPTINESGGAYQQAGHTYNFGGFL